MKRVLVPFVILCGVSGTLFAQFPGQMPAASGPTTPPDKAVARIDGHDITALDVQRSLANMPQEFTNLYQQNPTLALQQMYIMRYLASEADKKKLAEESPLKEQIEAARANMLAAAMLAYEQNHFNPTAQAIDDYYLHNPARFQQAKIKAISISFGAPTNAAASFEERARAELEKQLGKTQRTEDEARARANEVMAKLKAGADFAQLVKEYSDDEASKANAGDFGFVRADGPQPEAYKKAILALAPGQVSEPLRLPGSIIIARMEGMGARPKLEVYEPIIQQLRQEHFNQWIGEISTRFQPAILAPEFFPAARPQGMPAPGTPQR